MPEGLSDEQLAVISKACELLARLQMGQLEEVVGLFERLSIEDHQELVAVLTGLKPLITKLSSSQHLGINHALVPDMARNAFDIHQTIMRHWQQKSHLVGTHHVAPPRQYGTSPLPKIRD